MTFDRGGDERRAARRPRELALAAVLALWLIGCGQSYAPDPGKDGGQAAAPLASIYDIIVTVPGLSFPQYGATGLTADLTIAIDDAALPPSGDFQATITVNDVQAGGVSRPFAAPAPLSAAGRLSGADWTIESFGPIDVGNATIGFTSVMLSLAGTLSADGRTIDGLSVATSSGETGSFHAVKQRRYLVAATDFGVTGTVSLVRVRFDTRFEVDRDLEAISGDPVARATGGAAWIVNRLYFDNIQSLDASAGFRTTLQFSTGNASNPHDVLAVDPNRLFITRYEPPYNDILIADRSTGATLGFIDLSGLATNASGTPRADGLVMADGLVFAGLQNIDGSFTEYGPGLVAAIDPATAAVERTIVMTGLNPFGRPAIHPSNGHLYFAMAGVFQGGLPQQLVGGIEVVDPRTLTTLGLLVDDDLLGGNVSSVALSRAAGADVGYCIVTTTAGVNMVRRFDPDTGAVAAGVVYQSATFLPELVADGDGYILVAEHDLNDPRLVVIDAATGSVVATPRISLPPFSIAVLTRTLGGA
jgi:hypothetical protein